MKRTRQPGIGRATLVLMGAGAATQVKGQIVYTSPNIRRRCLAL
jgi:hypothetical protein